ncbi:DUF2304 domain-containing protein [Blastopirellula retiformator]|uniref:DUF2304 domain-containing protein n=1 Tax=Blastopirellula retiformator TaxID=2527970 RepID=A0A5C5VM48_9BACT|nr:DUF2304 domain-containing protein [Blastopirellula retiformator]TWT39726.1 hypothetical protein Enr8_14270 [Blastopirellula retiformator]
MTPFQWIAITFIIGAAGYELVIIRQQRSVRLFGLFRGVIWFAAALAILFPNQIGRLASLVGIGRGADVILYSFVLVFLATTFYFYSRYLRLQRQITDVVRYMAIQEATRGTEEQTLEEV